MNTATRRRPPKASPKAAIQDWLNLVDPDGAFLTTTELFAVFPNGFEPMPAEQRTELRARTAEVTNDAVERADLREWLLATALDWDDLFADGQRIPTAASVRTVDGVELRPTHVLLDTDDANRIRLGVFAWPLGTPLERRADATVTGDSWSASPVQRAETWCRENGTPLALVTDDDRWVLVWAPRGAPGALARWGIGDLADETILQAGLVSLLGARRFFAVSDDPKTGETLARLFERAADAEVEVTKGLGSSVRQSVELLVAAMSRDHVASGGEVLRGVPNTEIYEASVTVLMRLVFLLFAEERRLLPAEDPLWAESYSVLTLRNDLRVAATRDGEDALERRSTAWHRLLATFRAVHGGVNHDRLTLPAYGGSLFDPDRFPFLEGRRPPDHLIAGGIDFGPADDAEFGPGRPVAIDDRTVLAILDSLLTVQVKSGRTKVAQRVSYKALEVEQIGHCYEGLLDHGCAPIDVLSLGLTGPEGNEPEITVDELEDHAAAGMGSLCEWLSDKTRCNRSESALTKDLAKQPEGVDFARLRVACGHDDDTVERVLPYWGIIRNDLRGLPIVLLPGSQYVTQTSTRRNMGAQYTTKALAEEVVQYALEPLVYDPGPQNEADQAKWKLKGPEAILDLRVCDPAVGSGAILTAAGRYLAERLVESVLEHGAGDGRFADRLQAIAETHGDDQTVLARREIVDHCLYGVDKNPVAAEMAKLSLWLTTMARERPFTFLDHAIQVGDSLLGITDLDQLRWLHLDPSARKGAGTFETLALEARIKEATELARQLQELSVVTIRDAAEKRRLHNALNAILATLLAVADAVVGAAVSTAGRPGATPAERLSSQLDRIRTTLDDDSTADEQSAALDVLRGVTAGWLRSDLPDDLPMPWERACLHWPLVFPEVFLVGDSPGFDAFVGNPPYMGNKYWKERIGRFLQTYYAGLIGQTIGKPDLIVLFVWRMKILTSDRGVVGSLATQSIAEVDSKKLMAAAVLEDFSVYRAVRSRQWPGEAQVHVSQIWLAKGRWTGAHVLDGAAVDGIDADLRAAGEKVADPHRLGSRLFAFQGIDNSRGTAMVIDPDDRLAEFDTFFRPLVTGEDLSQGDPTSPPNLVLDLTGRSEADLQDLPPEIHEFLFGTVYPTRTPALLKSYKNLDRRWWTFWMTRADLFDRTRRAPDSIVMPAICKHLMAFRLPSNWAYTNKVVVFDVARADLQSLVLSPAFDIWFRTFGGTMGKSGRVMKIAAVVDTFPLPNEIVDPSVGDAWQRLVFEQMSDRRCSANKVLDLVADPREKSEAVLGLRQIQAELHELVAAAYGFELPAWKLGGENEDALQAWLVQLLQRNRSQHEAEVASGTEAASKRRGKRRSGGQASPAGQESLL